MELGEDPVNDAVSKLLSQALPCPTLYGVTLSQRCGHAALPDMRILCGHLAMH